MTTPHNTVPVSNVWSDQGQQQGYPVKILPLNIIKSAPKAPNNVTVLETTLKPIYKDAGLEETAKEAGILEGGRAPVDPNLDQSSKVTRMIQVVTVPKAGASTAASTLSDKVYLVKSTNSNPVLSKVIHATQHTSSTGQKYLALPSQVLQIATGNTQLHQASTTAVTHPRAGNAWDSARHKRPACLADNNDGSDRKRLRKSDKVSKGLRHFSMKVCEKVQQKVTTTYNEVADELVAEFTNAHNLSSQDLTYDQKNIRRRVYDALNVLMAMDIISKEKKEIRWIGLPTNTAQEYQLVENEVDSRRERTKQKRQQLHELLIQQIAFKSMVNRNGENEKDVGSPPPNSAIQLPFIIVNTNKKTVIDCSISNDKYEYLFTFDNTFEIHDDIEMLKRMGLAYNLDKGQCTAADLNKALRLVPEALKPYVIDLSKTKQPSTVSCIRPPDLALTGHTSNTQRSASPLALPLPHRDSTDSEVAMVTNSTRPSTFMNTSVPHELTPSEGYSDTDSDCSSPVVDIL